MEERKPNVSDEFSVQSQAISDDELSAVTGGCFSEGEDAENELSSRLLKARTGFYF